MLAKKKLFTRFGWRRGRLVRWLTTSKRDRLFSREDLHGEDQRHAQLMQSCSVHERLRRWMEFPSGSATGGVECNNLAPVLLAVVLALGLWVALVMSPRPHRSLPPMADAAEQQARVPSPAELEARETLHAALDEWRERSARYSELEHRIVQELLPENLRWVEKVNAVN